MIAHQGIAMELREVANIQVELALLRQHRAGLDIVTPMDKGAREENAKRKAEYDAAIRRTELALERADRKFTRTHDAWADVYASIDDEDKSRATAKTVASVAVISLLALATWALGYGLYELLRGAL